MKITLPADVAIDAEVYLNLAEGGYFLSARLNVSLPGVEPDVAHALIDERTGLVRPQKLHAATSTSLSTLSELPTRCRAPRPQEAQ